MSKIKTKRKTKMYNQDQINSVVTEINTFINEPLNSTITKHYQKNELRNLFNELSSTNFCRIKLQAISNKINLVILINSKN